VNARACWRTLILIFTGNRPVTIKYSHIRFGIKYPRHTPGIGCRRASYQIPKNGCSARLLPASPREGRWWGGQAGNRNQPGGGAGDSRKYRLSVRLGCNLPTPFHLLSAFAHKSRNIQIFRVQRIGRKIRLARRLGCLLTPGDSSLGKLSHFAALR
jgi:hypothetical protein